MIWAELGAAFLIGMIVTIMLVIGASIYAVKHPDKMMPHIMRAMRSRRNAHHT